MVSPQAQEFLRANKPITVRLPVSRTVARVVRLVADRELRGPLRDALSAANARLDWIDASGVGVGHVTSDAVQGEDHIFYIHGGAFVVGLPVEAVAVNIAAAAGLECFAVRYDLSPEAVFPRALEQCLAAWESVGKRRGGRRVLVGMSAGGNLALALLAKLLERGASADSLPSAVVLITPWADLTNGGRSHIDNAGLDPVLVWKNQLDKAARAYLGGHDPADPLASPVHQDWSGLSCPVLITTGTRDLLLSDCQRVRDAMSKAGVQVELDVAPGMWHGYQEAPIPEAEASISRIGGFITRALSEA